MFINYYLENLADNIKSSSIKILCLFFKFPLVGFKLYHIYQRILFNLVSGYLKQDTPEEMTKLFLKAIYSLYEKVPHSVFIEEFLNTHTHTSLAMKIKKLEIL